MNNLPEPKYTIIVSKWNKTKNNDVVQDLFINSVHFKLVSNEKYVKIIKIKHKPVKKETFNEFKHLVEYFYNDLNVTYATPDE